MTGLPGFVNIVEWLTCSDQGSNLEMSLSKQLLHFAWQGPLNVCLGAFTIHLSELAGQTSPVILRIPLLQLSSLQISLFLKLMIYVCTAVTGFSKNVEKRLIFHLQNDRSCQPVPTFGKRAQLLI